MKSIFCLFLTIIVLFSCNKEKEITSKTSQLDYFDQIIFNSYFDVVLIQGNENSIRLEGHEKVIDNIDFYVKDSILNLKNKLHRAWLNPSKSKFKVYLTFKDLKNIGAYQSCDIQTLDTLKINELEVIFASKLNNANLTLKCTNFYYWNNHPCGGKLTLNGTCDYLGIWNYALMSVDAKNLITKDAVIENSSKGDCFVNITNSINYAITGEGNIYCYGNPSIVNKIEENSSGKFIFK